MRWPATAEELKDAGYRGTARGRCKSCGRAIIWAKTPRGGDMPIEQLADIDGQPARFQSHFASCTRAEFHRRRKKSLAGRGK